jgi:hypothetical protein
MSHGDHGRIIAAAQLPAAHTEMGDLKPTPAYERAMRANGVANVEQADK